VDECSEHSVTQSKHRIRRALEHPNQLDWTGAYCSEQVLALALSLTQSRAEPTKINKSNVEPFVAAAANSGLAV